MTTRCVAPSKLILCGEHAVLYGTPALSMAIDLETHCTLDHFKHSANPSGHFEITLADFDQKQKFSFQQWQAFSETIKKRFQSFSKGEIAIHDVLKSPFDLILITLYLLHHIEPIESADWQLKIESDAPIGRGLGSSAAVILAVLKAVQTQQATKLDDTALLDLAAQIEAYQHGRSSGIDPATILKGGLLKYQMDNPIEVLEPQPFKAWLIDTGKPSSATGECVEWVKRHHQNDTQLWQAFTQTTAEIEQAWLQQDFNQLQKAIRFNHQLLCRIGVVPQSIQSFVQSLETQLNAAVKVCGAGSVEGDSAGILLCLSIDSPYEFCEAHGYHTQALKIQTQGVHCELA